MKKQSFISKLKNAIHVNRSLLCLGLDPDVDKFAADFMPDAPQVERLAAWCQNLIRQTSDLICCIKPNIAFFEQYGPEGLSALQQVLGSISQEIPVLMDAKRGDIGSTAGAYAREMFEVYNVDAVTLSPYLGRDSIEPFTGYEGKTVFILCQTSNPSAAEVQNYSQPALYRHIALLAQTWGSSEQIGLVVGATKPDALAEVRQLAPHSWILAPGIGSQGGNLQEALQAGLDENGDGLIVPVSRAIIYADDARQAALELRDQINEQRRNLQKRSLSISRSEKERLVVGLFEAGCVRFGEFTLSSGEHSPVYFDLRRIISFPKLMYQAALAYARIAEELSCNHLAGVPYAALPITATLSQHLGIPMIYTRKEIKAYGTSQAIEGVYQAGEKSLIIEDVVTTGESILKAIRLLENASVSVSDILVLVDRDQGGQQALAAAGYQLHAVLTIYDFIDILHDKNCIDDEMFRTVKKYLEGYHAG